METQVDFDFLSEKALALAALDGAIRDLILKSEEFDPDAHDKECDVADEYRRKWLTLKIKHESLKINEKKAEKEPVTLSNLKLPKLEIRKFDDHPKTWLAFWGQYKKIHEDSSLDIETKFQYLTQAMKEGTKARQLVESYLPTKENYGTVIATLKDRFARDDALIELYVCELLQLMTKKISLDDLYDKIVTNLQILESLGIVKDKYECILLPMIESALPEKVLLLSILLHIYVSSDTFQTKCQGRFKK